MNENEEKTKEKDSSVRIFQVTLTWFVIAVAHVVLFIIPFFDKYDDGPGHMVLESFNFTRKIDQFQWYCVPMMVFVLYLYFTHLGAKKYSAVLGATAMFQNDLFIEVVNSLILLHTGYAAPWVCNPKNSSYQVLIGWNIEIIFNFLTSPLACIAMLPKDKEKKYFGINNRVVWACFFATLHWGVELMLNYVDFLVWNFWWWNGFTAPILPYLTGYLPFYLLAFNVYDAPRKWQIIVNVVMFVMIVPATVLLIKFGAI